MSRIRQFSSERYQLNKSNLSHSRNNLQSSRYNNTPLQKYQIATPQSNKNTNHKHIFNQSSNTKNYQPTTPNNNKQQQSPSQNLKLSRKSSSSDYICVGCFNDKLASDKKRHIRQQLLKQKQQQKLNNINLINQSHEQQVKQSVIQRQINQVKNYNKQLIEHKKQQKLRQHQLQQQLNAQQKQQLQRVQQQERIKLQQKQTIIMKYKSVIKQQINQKQQKSHQHINEIQQPLIIGGKEQEQYWREKAHKQNLYRQQLLKQIKEREQLIKRQTIEKNSVQHNNGLGLTQAAYQRELQRQKKLNDKQQQILEESKRMKRIHQRQLYQQKLNQQKQQQQRIQQQRAQQQQQRKYRQQKQQQLDIYLNQIKQQIQDRKRKLFEEERLNHQFVNSSIDFQQKQLQRKSCKSCDKKFPKTYLTKIN